MLKKLLLTSLAASIFSADLVIKNKIEKGGRIRKIPGVTITKYHNYGAFRNLGNRKPLIMCILSLILTLVLTGIYILTLGKIGKNALKTGLTLMLGGAFSNTYDRLTRGYVVDYIRFKTPWKWLNDMIFNISDFFIIVGAMFAGIGM